MQPIETRELTIVGRPAAVPTLYEAEQDLVALFDTEALVEADQEAAFQRDLAGQLQATEERRDAVAAFIRTCEAQADFAGEEIVRLQKRRATYENVAERLRGYVLRIIERFGVDAKGKMRKLVGKRFTMSARACPVSLVIEDEDAVPERFKTVTVTMPATLWRAVQEAVNTGEHDFVALDLAAHLDEHAPVVRVDAAAVKEALMGPPQQCWNCGGIGVVEGGNGQPEQCPVCRGACRVSPTVAGADLLVGRYTLQIR